MVDYETAKQIALDSLNRHNASNQDLVILDQYSTETFYGWVFSYNSRRYAEGDRSAGLVGNGPVVVEKADGTVHWTSSSLPVYKERMANLERKMAEKYSDFS